MSGYIPFTLTDSGITLVIDNQLQNISSSIPHYKTILDAIKAGDYDEVKIQANIVKQIENDSNNAIKINSPEDILINDESVPALIRDKIFQFAGQGLPYEPIIAFWENLKENPSYRARNDLYAFLCHNGHPLTEEGHFIAYKRVRDDFTDCHTGKMDNSPGRIVTMERSLVDDNPNNTCSSGLHVASINYASNFGSGRLLYCKVNPRDVVSIPTDYDNEKMRCCRYEVLSESEGERTEFLFGHQGVNRHCENEFNKWYDLGCELAESLGDTESMLSERVIAMHIGEVYGVDLDPNNVQAFIDGYQENAANYFDLIDDDDDEDDELYDEDVEDVDDDDDDYSGSVTFTFHRT